MPYISRWALATAVLVQQTIGLLWYSSWMFGTVWVKAAGKTPNQLDKDSILPFLISLLASTLITFALVWLIQKLRLRKASDGAWLGVKIAGAFFVLPTLVQYSFLGLGWMLLLIHTTHILASFAATGALLVRWPSDN